MENCLFWTGAISTTGYGRKGKGYVHRIAYEEKFGKIPKGSHIHHKCNNPLCYNADHLEIMTPKEHMGEHNSACAINSMRTHCKNGHEFTPENTITRAAGRQCRECHTRACFNWHERKRNAL